MNKRIAKKRAARKWDPLARKYSWNQRWSADSPSTESYLSAMGNKFSDLAARTMSAESRERAAVQTKALIKDTYSTGADEP